VHLARKATVAIVTIDNPPVNALSDTVRAALADLFEQVSSDRSYDALIITGEGRTFTAGADFTEMDQPLNPPSLPELVGLLDRFPKPVAAALNGPALGGGLELALACRIRVAAPQVTIGLPETRIGLVPGSGGTQRLLRLLDFSNAARFVAAGAPVDAEKALAMGLIHAIDDAPLDAAIARLRGVLDGDPLPPSTASGRPSRSPADLGPLRTEIARSAKGRKAPLLALDLMVATAGLDFSEGLKHERALFLKLRGGPENRALRHLFTAERAAGKSPALRGVNPRPVSAIGIAGGGLMGCGIAYAALGAGYAVTLVELSETAAEAARKRLGGLLDGAISSGRLSSAERDTRLAGIRFAATPEALAGSDLVIEAVLEDMDVKQRLFSSLDSIVSPETILATNTSYLDVDALAASTSHPRRVGGLHFFSPAHIMKLAEVVRGKATAPEIVATLVAVARKLGKIPIVTGVCEGFCANRILKAWRAEAEAMVEDGAGPEAVDRAMTAYGLAMGPFAVQDLAGLEIAAANRRLNPPRRPDGTRLDLLERLVTAGRLGAKAGRGWYDYEPDGRTGAVSPEAEAIIAAAAAEKGIVRRSFSEDELRDRQLAAIRAEAAKLLAEGIVATPADVDLAMVHGFGFPAYKGGPLFETLAS
jgi:3-hydroxyacyl-CoA dehydrogenase